MTSALLRGTITQIALEFNGDLGDQEARASLAEKLRKKDAAIDKNIQSIERAYANPNWSDTKKKRKVKKYQERINDLREEKKEAKMPKDNIVVATFSYPRSGHSSVMTTRPMDIPSDQTNPVEPNQNFFDAGLFKEEIQGETEFQISVTDKDKANSFVTFLRTLLSSVLNAVTKDAVKGISEVLVSETASETSNLIEKALKGDGKDKIVTVARSKKVKLSINADGGYEVLNGDDRDLEVEGDTLRLVLRAPDDLTISYRESNVKASEPVYLKKGQPNGFLVLRLKARPV